MFRKSMTDAVVLRQIKINKQLIFLGGQWPLNTHGQPAQVMFICGKDFACFSCSVSSFPTTVISVIIPASKPNVLAPANTQNKVTCS